MVFTANVFTVNVFCALLDCPAATRVWGPVSPCSPWKKTCYWRANIGNLCQRNYGLRSKEQLSYIKPQISLVGDRQSFSECKFTFVFVHSRLYVCLGQVCFGEIFHRIRFWYVPLIFPQRRKLTIECSPSGKKHSFVTESSKIAQYLLNLCSAQHKFHSEMTSRQLAYCLASGGFSFSII